MEDDFSPSSAAALSGASQFLSVISSAETISRATSPGIPGSPDGEDIDNSRRHRPRTFSYFQLLPYSVEDDTRRDAALEGILKQLYISIKAEDFSAGATHWTRQLSGWLALKFDMPRRLRADLAKLYYHLALAPGLNYVSADRFSRMVVTLARRKHLLKPQEDLTLDWRPIWKEIKALVLPHEAPAHHPGNRRMIKQLWKLCMNAYIYFDPCERRAMLDELLLFFSTSEVQNAYIVIGALNVLVPTTPAPPTEPQSQPSDFLPTFFHLWSLMARSKMVDTALLDLFSRLARDYLPCRHVPFSAHGIFTREQSDLIFTSVLRSTEIPVGQANSPYTTLDYSAGMGVFLEKDKKKCPIAYSVARWIIACLSPYCLDRESSVLNSLEGLMESVDTFFHPSNQGAWTTMLAQLTYYLTEMFVSRWNKEQRHEQDTPIDRQLNDVLKRRFVLSLREVTFMGIFGKSSKITSLYFGALQNLTYLEPELMLPGALQRFYPSLQGLVEVHRTTSSLCGLQMIANIMTKQKGFRCHITPLLGLALPGIDANDLNKTQYTLNFIQSVAYSIPFVNLAGDGDISLAMQWVQGEMERMEREGQDVQIDYRNELSDEQELKLVCASTAGFGEFIIALLGKVFTLLENLPDASQQRTGSPEDNIINSLPAALTPLFAALSPELFDTALEKLVNFVTTHVVYQARDAMAWTCNALCKVNPEKTLKIFIKSLTVNIRNEIDFNGAASDRSSGTEVLPRDRALVWHVSILSMCVVHVGNEVLKYKKPLFEIAEYMQEKCRGLPTIHISNYIHHLLLNLTHTYPIDNALYEPEVVARGLGVQDWGQTTSPDDLTIRWHRPTSEEIEFAVELFRSQAEGSMQRLEAFLSNDPPVSRKGKNKEWSDEVSRQLTQLRLLVSGVAALFDTRWASGQINGQVDEDGDQVMASADGDDSMKGSVDEEEDDPLAEAGEDDETRPQFRYSSGYLLATNSSLYREIHEIRDNIGRMLSRTHAFLNSNQEDDVACFTALYSTYRTWITDVGFERSAHPLERLQRLYRADVHPFKISGLRKVYPRPLLIRRADAYQLQRVKHNCMVRAKSEIDKQLLLDLAESCVSPYTDVRRVAQGAQDASLKALIGGRPLVIAIILDRFRKALDESDHDRVKGSMYTLIFTSLLKTLLRDWRFAPDLMRLYIKSGEVDKASIQNLCAGALYPMIEFGKRIEMMVLVDNAIVDSIKPERDCGELVKSRYDFVVERRKKVEEKKSALGLELIDLAKKTHWKTANRCVIFALNLCLRFNTIVPPEFVDLVAHGTNDPHPGLRMTHLAAFSSVFTCIDQRAEYSHSFRNYLEGKEKDLNKIVVPVPKDDPDFTEKFLESFKDSENVEYFVDTDHPGWLVWGKEIKASRSKPRRNEDFDEVEMAVRKQIGKIITKDWLATCFAYLKQEPRDTSSDKFRTHNVLILMHVFDFMIYGVTEVTFEDVKTLIEEVYGDGSDKHQHRATAEILGALLGLVDDPVGIRERLWGFALPMLLGVFNESLTPENLSYWLTCLHFVLESKDPRRAKGLTENIASFSLDMSSNAAFKESAKVQLLEFVINDGGWHFRHEKPILQDFLAHIDHPYKSVRESIGRVIASIYRTRYHESFQDVATLLESNKADSPSGLGIRPYPASKEFSATIEEVFTRLEKWRHEREPGQQTPCSYTSGSKTVLTWLDSTLSSQECTLLVPFFHKPFIDQLLHMMDVKEDPELMRLAYHVYRHLPNIPFRNGEDAPFIAALIRLGKSASSWHQRLRALVNMQVIYFRRLFLTDATQRDILFNAVGDMLADSQLEVRTVAGSTLAGMIRCSPAAIRNPIIHKLKDRFEMELEKNPMPKKKAPGTDTPTNVTQQIARRHAAVLGLGSLIEAFPYATPPPKWMPEVLALIARRAAGDPGIVGKASKSILSEFKKTRQDSWGVDQKYFTSEQLEDLEGVLWKSYFA